MNTPAVGDVNSDAKGSGARFNSGKAALDMIPLHLLEGAARVFHKATTREENPYPKWNWACGMPWSVPVGCIKRHLAAFERGEDRDPDSGELHVSHILCNVLMLEQYYRAYPEGDDRCEHFKEQPMTTSEVFLNQQEWLQERQQELSDAEKSFCESIMRKLTPPDLSDALQMRDRQLEEFMEEEGVSVLAKGQVRRIVARYFESSTSE